MIAANLFGESIMDQREIVNKLSRVGILGNILLSAFKLFAGIFGKSGAMVSDAVHSLSDVFATAGYFQECQHGTVYLRSHADP